MTIPKLLFGDNLAISLMIMIWHMI